MTVFNIYLALIKKYMGSAIIYIGIFIGMALIFSASYNSSDASGFQTEDLPIAVIDDDNSVLSSALTKKLSADNRVITGRPSEAELNRMLYYRDVYYIVTVPAGFEKSFLSGEEISLGVIKCPGTTSGYYLDSYINGFLGDIKACVAGGFTVEEAAELSVSLEKTEPKVNMLKKAADGLPAFIPTLRYLPYLFICAMSFVIGNIMLSLRKENIYNRLHVTPVPSEKQTFETALAFGVFMLFLFVLAFAIPLVINGTELFTGPNFALYLLNGFALLLFCGSLSFFIGTVTRTEQMLSALVNIFGLGLCFLGGAFVPLEIMSSGVLKFSRFLPSYWYEAIIDALADGTITSSDTNIIVFGLLIQLAYAATFFIISIVVAKKRLSSRSIARSM